MSALTKLTDEQLHLAAENYYKACARKGDPMATNFATLTGALREIAPMLQIPWDEPREGEVYAGSNTIMVREAVAAFVRMRNAALIPKPIDPRAKALHEALVAARRSNPMSTHAEFTKATADILRILDERGVSLDQENENDE